VSNLNNSNNTERNITIVLVVVGAIVVLAMGILTIYDLHHEADFKELSNWFQAFIAIWTLLAVFYTAMKAKQASDSASELTEKAFMSDLFIHISEKVNNYYYELIKISEEQSKLNTIMEKSLDEHQGNTQAEYDLRKKFEVDVINLWSTHGGRLGYINDMLDNIKNVVFSIEEAKFIPKDFYKKLFISYLNPRVNAELRIGSQFQYAINTIKSFNDNIIFSESNNFSKLLYTAYAFQEIQNYFNIIPFKKFKDFIEYTEEGA